MVTHPMQLFLRQAGGAGKLYDIRRVKRGLSEIAVFQRDPPVYARVKFPITSAVNQFNSWLHPKRVLRVTCPSIR